MPLTDIKCRAAKLESGKLLKKLADEKGLYLELKPIGKYWRFKYRYGGKEKRLAFGVYPEVTLAVAREKRDEARQLLRDGIDPSQAKKDKKLKAVADVTNRFEDVAREWHNNNLARWTPRHAGYIMSRLEADIFPAIGKRPIGEITSQELHAATKQIEARGAIDIAHRAVQTCGQIFRYAIITGRATQDVAVNLRGALKTRKKVNYSSLQAKEMPEFLAKLEAYDGSLLTKLAFKLLILTFVRTIELRGARWEEIDFANREWRIPAERMKMREMHIVPLVRQSIAILNEVKLLTGSSEYIFPHTFNPKKFMSENTLLYALYRIGYHSRATVHGFRATASTILNENGFHSDHIERQLAHGEVNKVRSAYNHAQYLPERRKIMDWWACHLDKMAGNGEVVEVDFRRMG